VIDEAVTNGTYNCPCCGKALRVWHDMRKDEEPCKVACYSPGCANYTLEGSGLNPQEAFNDFLTKSVEIEP